MSTVILAILLTMLFCSIFYFLCFTIFMKKRLEIRIMNLNRENENLRNALSCIQKSNDDFKIKEVYNRGVQAGSSTQAILDRCSDSYILNNQRRNQDVYESQYIIR